MNLSAAMKPDQQSDADSVAAPSASSAPVVDARELTKRYGDTVAMDGISLQVQAGEIYGLIGPDGAGEKQFTQSRCRCACP